MSNRSAPPAPIIVKKKSGHGGHHGGAWKVAYADFVTAMMALFIVLWLMASSDQVKKAVASYFLDPHGEKHDIGSGLTGSGESMALTVKDLEKLKQQLEKALHQVPELKNLQKQVTMTVTGEGLRIELLENTKGVFFETGKMQPTKIGLETITVLANELGKLPNNIVVEGHTDASPYTNAATYSNWELSSDRANEARRIMQANSVRADQIKEVRGFADQNLRNKANPLDASNRRISVIVQYEKSDPLRAEPGPVLLSKAAPPAAAETKAVKK